jgi:hypothetical protein
VLAVDTDSLHPDYPDEDDDVAQSVAEMQRLLGLVQHQIMQTEFMRDRRLKGTLTAMNRVPQAAFSLRLESKDSAVGAIRTASRPKSVTIAT